jgi:hypothetical protein
MIIEHLAPAFSLLTSSAPEGFRRTRDDQPLEGKPKALAPDFEEKPLAGGTRRANLPVI